MSFVNGNKPPILVYLAYAFSNSPTKNTKKAREMALALMKRHADWFILSPHFAVDALLDGTLDWTSMKKEDFSQWRRTQAGLMAVGFLSRCDILVLGCDPTYGKSHGVTWEHIVTQLLNRSWRRLNPIKIMTYEEAMR